MTTLLQTLGFHQTMAIVLAEQARYDEAVSELHKGLANADTEDPDPAVRIEVNRMWGRLDELEIMTA